MKYMPRTAASDRADRIRLISQILREQPLPMEALLRRFNREMASNGNKRVSARTLQHDLAWMQKSFKGSVIERIPGSTLAEMPSTLRGHRWFYRITNAEDLIPVSHEIGYLSEMEALAIQTARAILAVPPTPEAKNQDSRGPLADALGNLMRRLGFKDKDSRLPDILSVASVEPQAYDPAHALTILAALRLGEGLSMRYQPLSGNVIEVPIQPIRLALCEGDLFLWAWDTKAKKVKNYKLSRIQSIARCPRFSGVPSGLDVEVRGQLASSFNGVAGSGQRARVVIRFDKRAVPHIVNYRLGSAQTLEKLPDGGARLSFNTHGLDSVQHWVLQFGSQAKVIEPLKLAQWIRNEARWTCRNYTANKGKP